MTHVGRKEEVFAFSQKVITWFRVMIFKLKLTSSLETVRKAFAISSDVIHLVRVHAMCPIEPRKLQLESDSVNCSEI